MPLICLRNKELIDTLWNVKDYTGYAAETKDIRINRYTMECKAVCVKTNFKIARGINRYTMECKGARKYCDESTKQRINRHTVECISGCFFKKQKYVRKNIDYTVK